MNLIRPWFALFALAVWGQAQEISSEVSVQQHTIGANTDQKYFLIEHKSVSATNHARGLILILPGGPGSADFLPFCANVLTLYGIPDDFVAAELVAPQWSKDENRVVWPSKAFPDPQSKFTTEEFLAAVTKDVCRLRKIDERYIFTLGWSSSGHVLYSDSLYDPKVRGSIIAMSRFLPDRLGKLDQARGKNYFLYHSPEDQICPFGEAQLAERSLKEQGAKVKLVSYMGGHGWVPTLFIATGSRMVSNGLKPSTANQTVQRKDPADSLRDKSNIIGDWLDPLREWIYRFELAPRSWPAGPLDLARPPAVGEAPVVTRVLPLYDILWRGVTGAENESPRLLKVIGEVVRIALTPVQ